MFILSESISVQNLSSLTLKTKELWKGGGKHPPQCYNETKKPSAYRVKARFDTSGYSCKRVRLLLIGENKKVICLMKDELDKRIMTKFVALRLKLYTQKTINGSGKRKCKGVKKCVMKKLPDFDDYKQCLFVGENMYWKQLTFWNELHKVHVVEVNKSALSSDDDKQVVQSNGMSTLSHGHCKLEVSSSMNIIPQHTTNG